MRPQADQASTSFIIIYIQLCTSRSPPNDCPARCNLFIRCFRTDCVGKHAVFKSGFVELIFLKLLMFSFYEAASSPN